MKITYENLMSDCSDKYQANKNNLIIDLGKNLENRYILFKENDEFVMLKNCQSAHGWHWELRMECSEQEAIAEVKEYFEEDPENTFILEMQEAISRMTPWY